MSSYPIQIRNVIKDMSLAGTRARITVLVAAVVLVVSGIALFVPSSPPASLPDSENDRALIAAWRARQDEIREVESRFVGSLEGVRLQDLGTVAFVLEQSRGIPRRFLDPEDHNLVFSAVEGQSDRELEANLPAMVNYIKLSMSTRALLPAARSRQPLLGRRRGMGTMVEIARSVYDFRSEQIGKVRDGQIPPQQVLTKANLGAFGQRAMVQRLEQAYREGHEQFVTQRNLVVFGVLAVQLQFGFVVAIWIRRSARKFVVVRGRA